MKLLTATESNTVSGGVYDHRTDIERFDHCIDYGVLSGVVLGLHSALGINLITGCVFIPVGFAIGFAIAYTAHDTNPHFDD